MLVQHFRFRELLRKTFAAFVMKVLAALFGLLLNVVIARQLGVDGTGRFYLSLSCVSIAIMISQVGLGQSLLRFVSISSAQENWETVKGVVQMSGRLCLLISLIVAILIYFTSPIIAEHVFHAPPIGPLIQWMALAIVPGALFVLNGYSLQALGKIKSSVFVNGVSMPMFGIFSMLVLIPIYGIKGSVLAFVLSSFMTYFLSGYLLYKYTPQLRGGAGTFNLSRLLKSNVPLFWVSLAQLTIAWSSNMMLGIWGTDADVGIFSVANKTAILVTFILSCVNTVIAPTFAALYQEGDIDKLQDVVIKASLLVFVIAAPVVLVLMAIPGLIMSMFGDEFARGAPVLVILALGQFFFVITGTVGFLLTMSGHEVIMRNIMIACSIVLMILNWILIPRFGVYGAATAISITLILQNLIISVAVWKKIGVVAIPFINSLFPKSK